MTYHVVFDCTQLPPVVTHVVSNVSDAHGIALALVFLALGFSLFFIRSWLNEMRLIACIALIGGAYLVTYNLLPRSSHLVADDPGVPSVCTKAPKVVVGTVCDFVPMPASGHAFEHFCVRDVCFHYSDYERLGGFNNATSHGGPIKPGLSVRVSYVETRDFRVNAIVKLEIEDQAI